MEQEEKPLNEVDAFLDLVENKYAIKIKLEANAILGPSEVSRGLTYREKTLGAMFWKARELYRNDRSYFHDLRKIISSIKLQGYYEETEGLPRKYQDCKNELDKELTRNRELRKDMEDCLENYQKLKNDNLEMKTELDTLRRR